MAAGAITSIGTTLAYGDAASPEVFTTIGRVTSVSADGGDVAFDDTTDLSDIYVTRLATNIDEGTMSVDIVYDSDDAEVKALRADRANRTLRNFKLTYSDTAYESFAAYVTSISREAANGRALRGTIALQVSGQITHTDAP